MRWYRAGMAYCKAPGKSPMMAWSTFRDDYFRASAAVATRNRKRRAEGRFFLFLIGHPPAVGLKFDSLE